MFCMQCGTELPDGAKFCFNCGASQGDSRNNSGSVAVPAATGTQFVDAKCTNCGAKLEVDPNMKKASCSFCGAEFIVDQAINNYNVHVNANMNIGQATINVTGLNKNNLLLRAKEFEEHNKFDEAIDYYNRVLDIDFNDIVAQEGIRRINQNLKINKLLMDAKNFEGGNKFDQAIRCYKNVLDIDSDNKIAKKGSSRVSKKIEDFVFLDEDASGFLGSTRKRLIRDSLIIYDSKGNEEIYSFGNMNNLRLSGTTLHFDYPGRWTEVKVGGNKNELIYRFIRNALCGKLPPYKKL